MTDFRLKVAVAPRQAPVTTSPLDIGTYPTNIEGPGSAWAFVLSGTVFAARLTRSNFSTFAYEPGELGSQCAGNGFS